MSTARDKFRRERDWSKNIKEYSYRPFDTRWVYHSRILMTRPRGDLLEHISDSNIAIVTTRQVSSPPFTHAFATDLLPDNHLLSVRTKESAYCFPLFTAREGNTKLNIRKEIVQTLRKHFEGLNPQLILYYIYAILYSNIYRKTYGSSLLIDFPRIPFTGSKEYFVR